MMLAGARWQEGLWRPSSSPSPPLPLLSSSFLASSSRVCLWPSSHCSSSSSIINDHHNHSINRRSIVFIGDGHGLKLSASLQEAQLQQLDEDCIPPGPLLQPTSVSVPFGNRQIMMETGRIGRQASGSVTVTDGETILYATACAADDVSEPSDFVPLSVYYQERFSAAGRTSGGFFKREGRAKDHEILICRLIDRPLRPIIAKGFNHETQILSWVFSYDCVHPPEPLAIIAAGAALALSDIPTSKVIGAVRVGMVDGKFIVNPTVQEMELSRLDMIVAGSMDAVTMIEGSCDFLTEEELLEAITVGQAAVTKVCHTIQAFVDKVGKPKKAGQIDLPLPIIEKSIEDLVGIELMEALQVPLKGSRKSAISSVESKVMALLTMGDNNRPKQVHPEEQEVVDFQEDEVGLEDGEVDEGDLHIKPILRTATSELFSPIEVKKAFKQVTSKFLRKLIVQKKRRSDGRGLSDIRPIQCECGLLPRAHGSALFTRGETQALAVTTLGGGDMGQRLDNLTDSDTKRFYFQYSFPPSSVGEAGRIGAPSRREIGHGMLAEKALERALPSEDSFPYTIRLESTITESNGSSSMASVCGGCLAMLDAGVPLKTTIAGVAMGLILNSQECGGNGEPVILSDIIGAEDALGDMDFKIAGSETGITAFQMDIKIEGVGIEILQKALVQAKHGRSHIIGKMAKCDPPPARTISKHAPLIEFMQIEPEKVNSVIGSGGRTVRALIEQSGVDAIDLEDDGSVRIVGKSAQSVQSAKSKILGLTMDPVVGAIYRDCIVKSVLAFGCFVEIAPGREGLVHISELSTQRLQSVEEVLKVGDRIDVKLIEINSKGQLRLSHRALLVGGQQTRKESEGKDAQGEAPQSPSPQLKSSSQAAPDVASPKDMTSTVNAEVKREPRAAAKQPQGGANSTQAGVPKRRRVARVKPADGQQQQQKQQQQKGKKEAPQSLDTDKVEQTETTAMAEQTVSTAKAEQTVSTVSQDV